MKKITNRLKTVRRLPDSRVSRMFPPHDIPLQHLTEGVYVAFGTEDRQDEQTATSTTAGIVRRERDRLKNELERLIPLGTAHNEDLQRLTIEIKQAKRRGASHSAKVGYLNAKLKDMNRRGPSYSAEVERLESSIDSMQSYLDLLSKR